MVRALVCSAAAILTVSLAPPARHMTITFDDLPGASISHTDIAFFERVNRELIAALTRHAVPAIGFVNESKLAFTGATEPARVALLKQWLDAGLELGNHTYSHADLHATPIEEFKRDTLRGEEVTRKLLAAAGKSPRFFRHPYLHTGRDAATRAAFESFLREHGYRVAPVTVDNYDYMFARAYDRAGDKADAALQRRVLDEYVGYMTQVVEYYERQSQAIVGREIAQILLLHVSALNARAFDRLAAMLEQRGYTFIPIDRAVEDPAYQSRDEYYGPAGITWFHRWALTAGKRGAFFAGEPVVPEWIAKAGQ